MVKPIFLADTGPIHVALTAAVCSHGTQGTTIERLTAQVRSPAVAEKEEIVPDNNFPTVSADYSRTLMTQLFFRKLLTSNVLKPLLPTNTLDDRITPVNQSINQSVNF